MEIKTKIERRYVPVEVNYFVTEDGCEFNDCSAATKHEAWLEKKKALDLVPHFKYLDFEKEKVDYYYLSSIEDLQLLADVLCDFPELTNDDDFFFPCWYVVKPYYSNDGPDGYYITNMDVLIDWMNTYLHNIEVGFNEHVK